jgi:hypothetical protein
MGRLNCLRSWCINCLIGPRDALRKAPYSLISVANSESLTSLDSAFARQRIFSDPQNAISRMRFSYHSVTTNTTEKTKKTMGKQALLSLRSDIYIAPQWHLRVCGYWIYQILLQRPTYRHHPSLWRRFSTRLLVSSLSSLLFFDLTLFPLPGHYNLFIGGVLHRDVSCGNILRLQEPIKRCPGHSKGL